MFSITGMCNNPSLTQRKCGIGAYLLLLVLQLTHSTIKANNASVQNIDNPQNNMQGSDLPSSLDSSSYCCWQLPTSSRKGHESVQYRKKSDTLQAKQTCWQFMQVPCLLQK